MPGSLLGDHLGGVAPLGFAAEGLGDGLGLGFAGVDDHHGTALAKIDFGALDAGNGEERVTHASAAAASSRHALDSELDFDSLSERVVGRSDQQQQTEAEGCEVFHRSANYHSPLGVPGAHGSVGGSPSLAGENRAKMPDLTTHWLGLSLPSPLVVGASPLSDHLAQLAELVEAGAGAVVLSSLFEERIEAEQMGACPHPEGREVGPEDECTGWGTLGTEPYLERLRAIKQAVEVPVIASLNGVTPGVWTDLAGRLASAGADALELNLYDLPLTVHERAEQVEQRQLAVVEEVVKRVAPLPVAVKLSPYYTSLPHFASQLRSVGARGLTLFNRYYQPDIDLDRLSLERRLVLSTPDELPLRLHALALLKGRVPLSLAAAGGVHRGCDAAKAILCGASAVQMVSALLDHGASRLREVHRDLGDWMTNKGYLTVREACGVMRFDNVPNPQAWSRWNYARLLQQPWQASSAEEVQE